MTYTFGGFLRGNVPCPTCSVLIVTWQKICSSVIMVIGLYRLKYTASNHPLMVCASKKSIFKTVSRLLNHNFDARNPVAPESSLHCDWRKHANRQKAIKWSKHLHQFDKKCDIIEHAANIENSTKYRRNNQKCLFVLFSVFGVNLAMFYFFAHFFHQSCERWRLDEDVFFICLFICVLSILHVFYLCCSAFSSQRIEHWKLFITKSDMKHYMSVSQSAERLSQSIRRLRNILNFLLFSIEAETNVCFYYWLICQLFCQ